MAYKTSIAYLAFLMLLVFTSAVDQIGNRTVYLQTDPQSWWAAYLTCRTSHMQLLTLHSPNEHHEAVALLKKYDIQSLWLGAIQMGGDKVGNFVWATTTLKVEHPFWKDGQPGNAGGKVSCVQIKDDKWDDINCNTTTNRFFCQEPFPLTVDTPVCTWLSLDNVYCVL